MEKGKRERKIGEGREAGLVITILRDRVTFLEKRKMNEARGSRIKKGRRLRIEKNRVRMKENRVGIEENGVRIEEDGINLRAEEDWGILRRTEVNN